MSPNGPLPRLAQKARTLFLHYPKQLLAGVIVLNAIIATAAPAIGFKTLPRDAVEGFLWGRSFEYGYTKHPPLQAWILHASELMAPNMLWLAYLYAQICVAITFIAIWQLARSVLGERQGFLAILLTIAGVHTYSIPMANFTPDMLSAPLWALSGLFWWRAVAEKRPQAWYALGLTLAVSLYAKYVVLLLAFVLGLITLATKEGRAALRRKEPWLAMVFAFLLALPHLYWIFKTHFRTVEYMIFGAHAENGWQQIQFSGELVFAMLWQQAGLAGLLALLLLPGKSSPEITLERPQLSPFAYRSMLVMTLAPLTVVLLVQIVTGNEFRYGRLMCMFAFSGISAVMVFGPLLKLHRVGIAAALFCTLVITLPVGNAAAPWVKLWLRPLHSPSPQVYPAQEFANEMTKIWHKETGLPLRNVAGERWHAGNVAMYSPDKPEIYLDASPEEAPWITQEEIDTQGILLVWHDDMGTGEVPDIFSEFLPLKRQGTLTLPYSTLSPQTITLHYAIVPPVK